MVNLWLCVNKPPVVNCLSAIRHISTMHTILHFNCSKISHNDLRVHLPPLPPQRAPSAYQLKKKRIHSWLSYLTWLNVLTFCQPCLKFSEVHVDRYPLSLYPFSTSLIVSNLLLFCLNSLFIQAPLKSESKLPTCGNHLVSSVVSPGGNSWKRFQNYYLQD